MNEFITVVFKCHPDAGLRKDLTLAFKNSKNFMGAQITAISLEDEISRVEQLENAGYKLQGEKNEFK